MSCKFFIVKKAKKEEIKAKAEREYEEWLKNLKINEEIAKKKEEEEKEKMDKRIETVKKKREETCKKKLEENKKKNVPIRPLTQRQGQAIINGKLHSYYDWSTSPQPSWVNQTAWQS